MILMSRQCWKPPTEIRMREEEVMEIHHTGKVKAADTKTKTEGGVAVVIEVRGTEVITIGGTEIVKENEDGQEVKVVTENVGETGKGNVAEAVIESVDPGPRRSQINEEVCPKVQLGFMIVK